MPTIKPLYFYTEHNLYMIYDMLYSKNSLINAKPKRRLCPSVSLSFFLSFWCL